MRRSKARGAIAVICGTSLLLGLGLGSGLAATPVVRSKGQTIYATAYSYVLLGAGDHKMSVTSTLVIRNTDVASAITLTTVDYRDSKGGHVRHFVEEPVVIGPLASTEFVVPELDRTGGHSPSFVVQWGANKSVNAPVVETLMMGGRGLKGISFVGRAWVIDEVGDPQD